MLTYSEIERVIGCMVSVSEGRKMVLRSRLRHFVARGIPIRQAALGRGPQRNYNADHLFQLMIAMILTQNGLTPSTLSKGLRSSWNKHSVFQMLDVWKEISDPLFDYNDRSSQKFLVTKIEAIECLLNTDEQQNGSDIISFSIMSFLDTRNNVIHQSSLKHEGDLDGQLPFPAQSIFNISLIMWFTRSQLLRMSANDIVKYIDEAAHHVAIAQ